ncbi:50S ribosomal protein L9 [Enterobacteriaceae endosymbiont of Macroplea appendiculata]|uniref:50S ribosomal protein L9 n=1 Tax=Enterobacteriaceae endosymbiont of Macroplea appendiculata TaxID=2675790 RepID=UPI00144A2041|nr:50S ribosomal protein L9 [Enterobacteriaceae endosymbiont of Macroplea appendiculata]QJC30940.1 50S ribosomal protein L9 [Enterobacteriaceae endosymbiont of Macroplea appendiculata]
MQIILLDNFIGLGKKSEIINVKPGYARNYLIPKNIGILATQKNIHYLKNKIQDFKFKQLQSFKNAEIQAKKMTDIKHITIQSRASKTGKLFGSINKKNIILALKNMNFNIEKNIVILPKGSIKYLGQHIVYFHFHKKIIVKKNINVISYHK